MNAEEWVQFCDAYLPKSPGNEAEEKLLYFLSIPDIPVRETLQRLCPRAITNTMQLPGGVNYPARCMDAMRDRVEMIASSAAELANKHGRFNPDHLRRWVSAGWVSHELRLLLRRMILMALRIVSEERLDAEPTPLRRYLGDDGYVRFQVWRTAQKLLLDDPEGGPPLQALITETFWDKDW